RWLRGRPGDAFETGLEIDRFEAALELAEPLHLAGAHEQAGQIGEGGGGGFGGAEPERAGTGEGRRCAGAGERSGDGDELAAAIHQDARLLAKDFDAADRLPE